MRDFTKSVFSFSWALSLFGVQQALNLMRPSRAIGAFDKVTEASKKEMGDTLKATFKAGDDLQRGLMDMTVGIFTGQALNPGRWMKMTSDLMKQSAEAVGQGMRAASSSGQQGASGWGAASASVQSQPSASTTAPRPGASTASQSSVPIQSSSNAPAR
jgi:hypothetical protein